MKFLIVEDDFTSRLMLQALLSPYGECHTAANGYEAIKAFSWAADEGNSYQLVCLDIMMPGPTGQETLRRLRALEEERQISRDRCSKIVMITALTGAKVVSDSYRGLCDAFLTKPFDGRKMIECLGSLGLIRNSKES